MPIAGEYRNTIVASRLTYNQIKNEERYATNENSETNGKISSSLRFMSTPSKKVTIIGVLMDLGADRRGVDMGPSAVRDADLNLSGTQYFLGRPVILVRAGISAPRSEGFVE